MTEGILYSLNEDMMCYHVNNELVVRYKKKHPLPTELKFLVWANGWEVYWSDWTNIWENTIMVGRPI